MKQSVFIQQQAVTLLLTVAKSIKTRFDENAPGQLTESNQ